MSLTESTMLTLGTKAPSFDLPDTVSGKNITLEDCAGEKGTLVMFLCNHCPYVKHVNSEIVRLAGDFQNKGIGFVAISSNDVENYPDDSPEKMKQVASDEGYTFPYLYDESQDVAKAYDAACTPDLYLFDEDLTLYYRGRLDGSTPGNNVPLTGKDMREAIDRLLGDKEAPEEQFPSMGCNIKWKK